MEEAELFKQIGESYNALVADLAHDRFKEASNAITDMNKCLKDVLSVYNQNHSPSSPTMTINLDNCALLRQLIMVNALYGIGPLLFADERMVNWSEFSSVLKVDEATLRKGYSNMSGRFTNEMIESIVITSMSAGFVDDFEIAGVLYSLSYFIGFILKAKTLHLPFPEAIRFFFSHLSSFSYVLLVTCILSLQQSVFPLPTSSP